MARVRVHRNGGVMKIVFHGVRGSYPVPGKTTLRYGGNTSSQEIRAGGRILAIDAGTGVIKFGAKLAKAGRKLDIALFFSHNHHDHTAGLLYFKPAYLKSTTMHIYGPIDSRGDIKNALDELSLPPAHPVALANMGMSFTCDNIADGSVVRWSPGKRDPELLAAGQRVRPDDVVVRTLRNSRHPVDGVLNFRVEHLGRSYVYASDVEGDAGSGDAALAEFARGADLLAHDGQYQEREYRRLRVGWGHSTPAMAVKTAELAGVKRLAIIHHEPLYDDAKLARMEKETKKLFARSFFAKEGQHVSI